MGAFDSFYLMFKNNAGQTRRDVEQLDKAISKLASKGKTRTQQEEKDLKNLRKLRVDATKDLKDQDRAADNTGQSFTKLAESITGAVAAYAGFSALKNGILDASKFNSALAVQGKITGQNAGEIAGYAAEVEAAGGSTEEFIGSIQAMTKLAADAGQPLTKVGDLLNFIRDQIKGQPLQEQMRILGQLGINSPGYIAFLEKSNDEWQKSVGYIKQHADATNYATDADRKFEEQVSRTSSALRDMFSVLSKLVLPLATPALQKIEANASVLAFSLSHPNLDYVGPRPQQQKVYDPSTKKWSRNPALGPVPNDAYSFWLSQGYNKEQAAAWAANEQAESSGRPGAMNYEKGIHGGLYQWDTTRRDSILRGTGIDVYNSDASKQREAAAWEARQRGDDKRVMGAGNAFDAAAAVNGYFERSGEDPSSRGMLATQIAQQHINDAQAVAPPPSQMVITQQAAGQGPSITINKIEVHTQATDAPAIAKAISSELNDVYSVTVANMDDGQKR